MQKHLAIVSVVFILAFTVNAQEKLSESQKAIQQAVGNVFEALSNRDSITLKNYCVEDILLFEYGQVWNLDSLIQKAIKRNTSSDFQRVNTIQFLYTTVDKNVGWASYNLHSEITSAGKKSTVHWLETVVLVRMKKKWKLKVLHSTLIKRT